MSEEEISFSWLPGTLVGAGLLEECADLYSQHYGQWSAHSPLHAGERIRLSAGRIRDWLKGRGQPAIWYARRCGRLIGYAIAVQEEFRGHGRVSWVTQLVVHKEFRRLGVGKRLLFSIWGFSNDYAWGLLSANPYAIRALEKATRRRCEPKVIADHARRIRSFGLRNIHYFPEKSPPKVTAESATLDTKFFVDHSNLPEKIRSVEAEHPWLLGPLAEGEEWFAFTFRDQRQISLTSDELEAMLAAIDDIAKDAYSRMTLDVNHAWARHASAEVCRVVEYCDLAVGNSVLDFGSGIGRHCIEFARRGIQSIGVDFADALVKRAVEEASRTGFTGAEFRCGDCRYIDLGKQFDAVICLYDVVGTYPHNNDNQKILDNIAGHLKSGGHALISVMSYELTEHLATQRFVFDSEPDKLLSLQPSNVMEKTGNVFDPEFFLIDPSTQIVYRYEQFTEGVQLPMQLLVRDRRFRKDEIASMCERAGMEVVWSRFVRAGDWETTLDSLNDKAKEILVLCRKP